MGYDNEVWLFIAICTITSIREMISVSILVAIKLNISPARIFIGKWDTREAIVAFFLNVWHIRFRLLISTFTGILSLCCLFDFVSRRFLFVCLPRSWIDESLKLSSNSGSSLSCAAFWTSSRTPPKAEKRGLVIKKRKNIHEKMQSCRIIFCT